MELTKQFALTDVWNKTNDRFDFLSQIILGPVARTPVNANRPLNVTMLHPLGLYFQPEYRRSVVTFNVRLALTGIRATGP